VEDEQDAQVAAYAEASRAALNLAALPLQLFVLPPFTCLAEVTGALTDSPVMVGAQNCHCAEAGAWTGKISAVQVADCGATLVELSHSEEWAHFGETDALINAKVKAALAIGLTRWSASARRRKSAISMRRGSPSPGRRAWRSRVSPRLTSTGCSLPMDPSG
jgi:triosephosphate isomerase